MSEKVNFKPDIMFYEIQIGAHILMHRKPRFCGRLDVSFLQLFKSIFTNNLQSLLGWPVFSNRKVLFTYKGRTAVALACDALKLSAGSEVLMPSYNCGTEVDAVLSSGASVAMYNIDINGKLNVADIESRINNKTRAIYITHYFGWPQPGLEIKKLCEKYGISLIEDCALSLLSTYEDGTPIGSYGSVSIFSISKWFPLPDGGALVINNDEIEFPNLKNKTGMNSLFKTTLPLINAHVIRVTEKMGLYKYLLQLLCIKNSDIIKESSVEDMEGLSDIPSDYYFKSLTKYWNMSILSKKICGQSDYSYAVNRRRKNYYRLLNQICENNSEIKALYPELPDHVCPLYLPVFTENRAYYQAELFKLGIYAVPFWDGYHRFLNWSDYEDAVKLKKQILAIPVHQQLSDDHIDYIAQNLNSVLFNR